MDCLLQQPSLAPAPSTFEAFYRERQSQSQSPTTKESQSPAGTGLEMRGTRLRREAAPIEIFEEDENDTVVDESRDPMEESGCTQDDSEDEDIDESVLQDIEQFQNSFKDIGKKYRLINRIGEGR
jgi:cell division control protein 7